MTCVLVVEDDPWIQWMIADDLADRGHSVLTARDGKEALDRVSHTHPDVIILDLMLPRLDGWEFMDRYRAITGGSVIPIIVVTAARSPDVPTGSAGAMTWLQKPFDMEQLASTVNKFGNDADSTLDSRPEVSV